ncbi:MAG: hypothetical protein P9M14_11540 [Candidatus Alcyoniella australis]|nr:hypothetical protein [Candidatus Alcyoniella australis]
MAESKHTSAHPRAIRQHRAAYNALGYLMRTLLVWAALIYVIKQLHERYFSIRNAVGLMDVIAQLDLFHDLSYALLPAALLLLLAPRLRTKPLPRLMLLLALPVALAVSFYLSRLPLHVAQGYWPQTAEVNGSDRAANYLGLNLFIVLWFHVLGQSGGALQTAAARLPLLSDLLVPSLVWATGRARNGLWFAPLRVFQTALVCTALFVPWVIHPHPLESIPPELDRFSNAPMRRLIGPPAYQVFVHPNNGTLLMTINTQGIYLIDPQDGSRLAELEPGLPNMQIVAYDDQTDQYVYVDADAGRTLELDAATLQIVRETAIENPMPDLIEQYMLMTLLPDGRDTLAVYCQVAVLRVTPQGDRISAYNIHQSLLSSVEYDPRRKTYHVPLWAPGELVEMDGESLWIGRRLAIPNFAERTALDPQTDLLYVALPLRGQLLAVDLERYQPAALVPSFPGLRLVSLDHAGGRMIISGFAPLIEVRSLSDYSLIDRIPGPPWARWMDVDERNSKLYLTSCIYGLYELDLDALGGDSWPARWRRMDPFYPAAGLLARLITSLLGWN